MPRPLRRARGTLLRLVLQRRVAVAIGLVLLVPAVMIWMKDYQWESWLTDGGALIAGATGAALVLAGMSGRRGDWVDPD